ncbi:hypothetical protein M5689_004539 [Euphorbia peplus]|nr:hypothetical protein M5689_004539 [Euphorbia peplus]
MDSGVVGGGESDSDESEYGIIGRLGEKWWFICCWVNSGSPCNSRPSTLSFYPRLLTTSSMFMSLEENMVAEPIE